MDYSVVEKAFKENIETQKECHKYAVKRHLSIDKN